jgi:hypothetical protein
MSISSRVTEGNLGRCDARRSLLAIVVRSTTIPFAICLARESYVVLRGSDPR